MGLNAKCQHSLEKRQFCDRDVDGMPTLGEIRAVGKPLDERSDRTGYIWLLGSKVLHPDSPFPIPHFPPSPEIVLSKTDVRKIVAAQVSFQTLYHPSENESLDSR